MHGANPLDWGATQFLWLYGILIVGALLSRSAIAAWLRGEGRPATLHDEEEIALLAGGRPRLAEALIAHMLANGVLAMPERGRFAIAGRPAQPSAAERVVLAMGSRIRFASVARALKDHAGHVERRLVDRGLLMGEGEAWQIRLLQTAPFLLLLGFGWVRWKLGHLRAEDVGFLTMMMGIVAILTLTYALKLDRATKSARAELASLKSRMERLRRAPREAETGMAVALYGTGVLAGTMFAGFHQMRSDSGSGGCGSSGGSDGGSGGCGGCGD